MSGDVLDATTAGALQGVAAAAMIAPRVVVRGGARVLVISFADEHDALSWAIVNGGARRVRGVVWREVRLSELPPEVDAEALMRETLADLRSPDAVGLLTARDVRRYEMESVERGGVRATCVATVGLGNALAAGDPPAPSSVGSLGSVRSVGTINLLCQVSVGLSEEALIEASAIAVEARTAAVLEAALPSPLSRLPCTGTGTDCVVIAAPVGRRKERFAGKHTACGAAIGAAVRGAVARGVRVWLEENACTPR